MEQIINHQVLPENNTAVFVENQNIDFVMDFNNRSLLCNSIRLEADVEVYSDITSDPQTRVKVGDDCFIDPKVGGHSFIQSIVTSVQNKGIIENITEYARLNKMKADAQNVADDMFNSKFVAEMRSPSKTISQLLLLQKEPKEFGSNADTPQLVATRLLNPDFSIKPHMALNNVFSDNVRLSYQDTGTVRISLILEKSSGVLAGSDVRATYNYKLKNVRLTFMSVPDMGSVPVEMRTSLCLKSSLTSTFNNISSRVPAVSDSMTISFLEQSQEYNLQKNNLALQEPPLITNISYLFNDATNKFITFQIKDRAEMIQRGLESLSSQGSNSAQLGNISANESFLVGLNWETPTDLSNTKFNVQINSSINNSNAYIMFMYFHSIMSI